MVKNLLDFEYFDVTADIGFKAYGNSLDEAFENAGLAIFNIISDTKDIDAVKEITDTAEQWGIGASNRHLRAKSSPLP